MPTLPPAFLDELRARTRCIGLLLVSSGISLFVGIWSGVALVGNYSGWQAGAVAAYTFGLPVALCVIGLSIMRNSR